MANLTVFQGRRCTKVLRRAVNGTAAATPLPKAAGTTLSNAAGSEVPKSLSKGTTAVTSLATSVSTSVFAPTTNFPASGQQIATVIIPNIVSLVDPLPAPQVTPASRPPPQITSNPAPIPAASQKPNPPVNSPPPAQTSGPSPVPNNPPPPAPVPQNTPPPGQQPQTPPSPPQQQPNNPVPQNPEANPQPQQPQPNNSPPSPSPRPQQGQQPPPQPQNPTPALESPPAGRGGGSGGTAPELSQVQPQPSGIQPAQVGLPFLPSSIPFPLLPPLPQAQGTDTKTTSAGLQPVIPVLITLTSNGLTRTTLTTPSPSGPGRATDLGRLQPSQSRGSIKPTSTAGVGAGSGSGLTTKARPNNTPIIAGVVSAFVVIGIICTVIFIKARKKKQTPRDVVVSSQYSARSNSVRNVRNFFNDRFPRNAGSDGSGMRSTTPALESGMERTPYMSEIDPSRRRSSSEPASRSQKPSPILASQKRAMEKSATGAPMITPPSPHRRSVSSLSGMAYPVLTNTNNPFMDPDPNARLRIVNPDLSRSGSTATNPRTPGASAMKLGVATTGISAASDVVPAKMSPSPLRQASPFSPIPVNRSIHQRTPSVAQDPFQDPEIIMEDPFADPIQPPSIVAARNSRMGKHQRNMSSLASSASHYSETSPELGGDAHQRLMAGVPLITKTAPSSIGSSHRHNGSGDSGFVSNNNSPASIQTARFNGLGISNLLQHSVAPHTSLLPTSVPGEQTLLQPAVSAAAPTSSFAERRTSHNRLSSTSSASDLSLSFPSSWGSPGPTRPASIATQGGGSGTSLAAALAAANANYPSVSRPRDSRASDPFDLDDPTLLNYAASDGGGYAASVLSRENSERNTRGGHKRSETAPDGRRA